VRRTKSTAHGACLQSGTLKALFFCSVGVSCLNLPGILYLHRFRIQSCTRRIIAGRGSRCTGKQKKTLVVGAEICHCFNEQQTVLFKK
jgi:hypothetical protein